jgi:hypothetical protein
MLLLEVGLGAFRPLSVVLNHKIQKGWALFPQIHPAASTYRNEVLWGRSPYFQALPDSLTPYRVEEAVGISLFRGSELRASTYLAANIGSQESACGGQILQQPHTWWFFPTMTPRV